MMRWIFAAMMAAATVSVQADNYSEDPRLRRLMTDWVLDYRMPKGWLQRQFINVEKQDGVLERFNRQAESMPWFRYRPIFDNDERALLGAAFWQEHAETLARAQAEYGVPAAVIVAVIGVETKYGTITGSFRAIDALTTLALDYPRRSEFFTNELRELLLLALEENREASSFTGSYAGAMGIAQFMPSSYRAYAVDFDGDGDRDILTDPVDAIGSVAAYLARHGWRVGEPVVVSARPPQGDPDRLVSQGLALDTTLQTLRTAGVKFDLLRGDTARAKLFKLDGADGPEYYVALNNFYVITRYNRSLMYALSVHNLSRRIERLRVVE